MPTLTTSDGRTLAWHERGSGPPLLCHPGGPGSSAAYFGELADLAAERTLLLLDPRGTGESDRPADRSGYDLEDYEADIEALRRHLEIERLDLLAHSHGGAHEIAEALPNGTLAIVPGADHFPFLEPESVSAWSQVVLDFLRG